MTHLNAHKTLSDNYLHSTCEQTQIGLHLLRIIISFYYIFSYLPFLKVLLHNPYYVNQYVSITLPLAVSMKFATFAADLTIMKPRLLIISILTLLCTAFINAADKDCNNLQPEISKIIAGHISAHELSSPEHNILLPRQTNFASPTQTRTVSKRNNIQKYQFRYIFLLSGKALGKSFIETYQHSFHSFTSGLLTPYRHHLSLGRLII